MRRTRALPMKPLTPRMSIFMFKRDSLWVSTLGYDLRAL
jgi:hypothetical protein